MTLQKYSQKQALYSLKSEYRHNGRKVYTAERWDEAPEDVQPRLHQHSNSATKVIERTGAPRNPREDAPDDDQDVVDAEELGNYV